MHQPDYRDNSNIMQLPWVFLHAIKDYFDMPYRLLSYPKLKATFNLTPSLMEQILLLEKKGIEADYLLTLFMKEPKELNSTQKEQIIKLAKSPQFDTMVKPLASYKELYFKESFSDSELIELETLFLLSWCGNYLRENNSIVKSLLDKGSSFLQEDKEELIRALIDFIPKILPLYRDMAKSGQIEVSTTPLNHPILPLLIDINVAKRANSNTKLPANPISLIDDAKEHIKRAINLYKDIFGFKPNGFWPAEGAIDTKSIELYQNESIKWIATDEALLFKSIKNNSRDNLYKRHNFNGCYIAFRDHSLSDLIGFRYRYWDANRSSSDFISHLMEIEKSSKNPTLNIILDGENAWEFFANNAKDFFDSLYSKLEELSWCNTLTLSEASKLESIELNALESGSWINGDFNTWVGHPQKNRAWELIYQARRDINHHRKNIDKEALEKIKNLFLASECSDWFWWYGDDHYTDFALEFDTLFRKNIISIYKEANLTPPLSLNLPIIGKQDSDILLFEEPKEYISPTINGKIDSFFEWLGAGYSDESRIYSVMDGVRVPIRTLYWGQDDKKIYFRFDGDINKLDKDTLLRVYIDEKDEPLIIDFKNPLSNSNIEFAKDETIELSISKTLFEGIKVIHIRVEIEQNRRVIQILPSFDELKIDLEDNFSKNWFI